ncbi:type II toxin-antitoxin system Phd/YefM family antitoxin [Lactobacillus sp. PV037]|uniref:type II toxin-antitoxin system Phd/YefM family antitoxin n=1 Tax=unclassified Lactobacillus TaxID=2620435 RepID=UPI002240AA32|nr:MULTISPECIES: type II toxin-antitoxin system Phd/YefM family antitoxin [unclassified Lactobacillus]QNQ82747.1 type II toxin-antitoxin system Phd/YefM family antitoxin [Lactobacillus sp. PV012]QNQ83133.1 type II toxin-antitoxin system Phd/YefM family antitoxin [Lactobacillus sp. PV037]
MDAVNYSNFREHLKDYFKQVNDRSEPLIVTNKNPEDNVVILSKNEYDAIVETMEIQANSYLMEKIATGRREVESGKLQNHDLIDFEDKE